MKKRPRLAQFLKKSTTSHNLTVTCHYFRPPSQHEEVNRRRQRTHILLACITTVFFVCWGPLVFYTILYEFLPEIFPQRSVMASVGYTLSLLFGMLTPIANPGWFLITVEIFSVKPHSDFSDSAETSD